VGGVMTEDFWVGVVAGGGWGVFLGGFLGVAWTFSVLRGFAADRNPDRDPDRPS